MVTERLANQLGLAAILVMLALLLLVGFQAVPRSWEIPLFILAIALFAGRMVLRVLMAKRRAGEQLPRTQDPASGT